MYVNVAAISFFLLATAHAMPTNTTSHELSTLDTRAKDAGDIVQAVADGLGKNTLAGSIVGDVAAGLKAGAAGGATGGADKAAGGSTKAGKGAAKAAGKGANKV